MLGAADRTEILKVLQPTSSETAPSSSTPSSSSPRESLSEFEHSFIEFEREKKDRLLRWCGMEFKDVSIED